MKFVCDQSVFAKALTLVAKAISSHTTLPVLENILLKAEGSVLTLTATNLEISISTYIEVEVEEDGAVTLPAKILVQYVNLLPANTPIKVEMKEGATVHMDAGVSKTKMKGIPAEDFPILPTIDAKATLNLERTQLLEGMDRTIFSTSTNTTRPILSGVLFQVTKGRLTLASTDSFRLSEQVVDQPGLEVEEDMKFIVPARTLSEVGRIFTQEEKEGYIHVHVGSNQVMFSSGETKLISRLIEGTYPPYSQIIPKETKTEALLAVEEVIQIVKRVNLFAKDNNFHVKFAFHPDTGKMDIYTESVEAGEEHASMQAASITGEEVTIALNSTFVLDAFGHMKTPYVKMQVVDPMKPALLYRMLDEKVQDQDFTHLIMPLRG